MKNAGHAKVAHQTAGAPRSGFAPGVIFTYTFAQNTIFENANFCYP